MKMKKSFIRLSKDGWEKKTSREVRKNGKNGGTKMVFEAKKVF